MEGDGFAGDLMVFDSAANAVKNKYGIEDTSNV